MSPEVVGSNPTQPTINKFETFCLVSVSLKPFHTVQSTFLFYNKKTHYKSLKKAFFVYKRSVMLREIPY